MKRKYLALAMMTTMVLSMTACGSSAPDSAQTAPAEGTEETPAEEAQETPAAASGDVVTINVGYENATTEPAAKAVEKWKELVEEKSGGSIVLELFPNSALGKKTDLIDQMIMGENVITVADGAFLADYGVPDFGIFYAPFMFDTWEEEWAVIDSDWYAGLCDQLASNGGLRVLSSNWIYGSRDIMSIKPVTVPEDLKGMKLRVSSNDLSITSFNDLGAASVGMDMGDVYQALQAGTIDAVENPVVSLANRSFQEVAKYVVRDGHILATSMWVCGESFYQSLTPEQQQLLSECADEAGLYNNELQDEATEEALKILDEAGVTVTELTDEQKAAWIEAGQYFYQNDTAGLGWSEGLYETVKAAGKQ
ncbi:MAG: TRAP transporter substrate-binding protein DctP [Lachnospiraceae bacterium]|jgi:tripartite ATP-independent transporter DctP family solute receptor|nr:TRAP transporter substrate-binding protein DctP [Lachnospiraceae bacterium]